MKMFTATRYEQFISIVETVFKLEFLLFGILTYNAYTFGRPVMSVAVWISTALAGVLLLDKAIHFKRYIRSPFLWLLVAFMVSYILSALAQHTYGFSQPAKTLVWMAMKFLLLFLCDPVRGISLYKKQFKYMCTMYVGYMFVASSISIVQLLINHEGMKKLPNGVLILSGVVWGRLWGVYTDPNYGAVMATVAIIITVFAMMAMRKKWLIIAGSINVIVQLFYISFSDSRTSVIVLTVCATVAVYSLAQRGAIKLPELIMVKSRFVVKQCISIGLAMCIGLACFFISDGIQIGYNAVISPKGSTTVPAEPGDEEPILRPIGRPDDISVDISNRRFDLWKSGLEVFMTSPLIGVVPDHFMKYADEHLPKTYLVNNDHGKFGNFHNSYVDVLAGQGLLGSVIAVVLVCWMAVYILKGLSRIKIMEDYRFYLMILCLVISGMIAALFLREVFYTYSTTSILLWSGMGLTISYIQATQTKGTDKA